MRILINYSCVYRILKTSVRHPAPPSSEKTEVPESNSTANDVTSM